MTFGVVSAASLGLKWAGTAAGAPFSDVAYIRFWLRKLSKPEAFWATCAPLKMKMGSLRTALGHPWVNEVAQVVPNGAQGGLSGVKWCSNWLQK